MATSVGGQAASGDIVIARLRLKLLQAGSYTVRFSRDGWRETDAVYQGASVLAEVQAAEVTTVAAAPWAVYLPIILKP
jgi:hypothetical protein